MRSLPLIALLACLLPTHLSAEPLSFREARKAVLNARGVVVAVGDVSFLGEKEQTIIKGLKDAIPYYGALALSPDEGLYVEWLNAAAQHHSLKSARAAALAHCEANRKPASSACVIVLEIRPKGKEGALTLSAPATQALRKDYRKLKAPKAFAISEKTGNFGFAKGDGTRALAACATAVGPAQDCRILVQD